MRRRDLFSSLPAAYSLAFLPPPSPAQHLQQRRDLIQSLSPPPGKATLFAPEPHMTLVDLHADLLVAGGGLAGVCTAVAAAREGLKVILLNDRSRLGGNSSSEVKMHVVGASCHKGRPGWRESGLLEEFRLDDVSNNPHRSWELWDLLLYDKVISEPNIQLLLETTLYSAEVKEGRIRQVVARCDRSEHLYRIQARMFVDATGDSRLGLEAGAEMRTGREARSEFHESLAPEKTDQETLGSSILFTSRLYPRAISYKPPKWARKVTKDQLKFRTINSWEYGYWWIEWGGDRNIIKDNELIRLELLSIVTGIWDYIKNSGEFPTSANYGMDWVGFMPGKRGSRRLVGDHILTQHDLEKGGDFPDAVAIGGWPMDDHPPGGFDRADLPPNTSIRTAEVYNIPLRSLYSRNIANLMMAGRNISASHVAFTSTRVMGTCAVIGQAVGTAAAQCIAQGITPRQLAEERPRTEQLQRTLLRNDQTIRGVRNTDPKDLARTAKLTSSAADPSPILSGLTRDIPKKEIHHWEAPLSPGGAWVELTWDRPQRLREIQITFDSGFQRELTLTSSDAINRGIIRAPQPETVKDYKLLLRGAATKEIEIKGNHQRLNRHHFDPIEVRSVRIHVTATNGADTARIFEVRCYA